MIDYHEYFGVMRLPAEQIKKRIQTAEELEDEFFEFLSELKWANGSTVLKRIEREFAEKLEQFVAGKTDLPMFAAEYSDKVTDAVYSYTMERAEAEKEKGKDIQEEPLYVFSIDRAALLAAGAALAIWAYREYVDAYSDGYTTKTWVCMMDGKERDSHAMADGQTVGIDEYFTVGDCQMLYPCDYLNGDVSETANCRCWCEYGGKGAAYDYHDNEADLKKTEKDDSIEVPDYYVGTNAKALPAEYREWVGRNIREDLMAIAKTKAVKNLINDLYRRSSFIGDGGTASALRFEKQTGLKINNGNDHYIKAVESSARISKILNRHVITPKEEDMLLGILEDLRSAIEDYEQ